MEYIDLGLHSGTLWVEENEEGYYSFDDAVEKYGNSLPTKEQFEELQAQCKWKWNGSGYDIIGPNGKYIVLPAEGLHYCDGDVDGLDSDGIYLSSTPKDSDYSWDLRFYSGCVYIDYANRCYCGSVRLVKNKNNGVKDKELNIAEILKDCPEGTPLYSPIFGNVTFQCINHHNDIYPIMVNVPPHTSMFTKYGRYTEESGGECMLFPSKDNRDWKTFKVPDELELVCKGKQKSTWDEEDERLFQCLTEDQEDALNKVKNSKYGHSEIISDLKEMYEERIDWLKSIKQKLKGK